MFVCNESDNLKTYLPQYNKRRAKFLTPVRTKKDRQSLKHAHIHNTLRRCIATCLRIRGHQRFYSTTVQITRTYMNWHGKTNLFVELEAIFDLCVQLLAKYGVGHFGEGVDARGDRAFVGEVSRDATCTK